MVSRRLGNRRGEEVAVRTPQILVYRGKFLAHFADCPIPEPIVDSDRLPLPRTPENQPPRPTVNGHSKSYVTSPEPVIAPLPTAGCPGC
jgi:hypothetical protein